MALLKNETRSFRAEFLRHMEPFGGLPPAESIRIWGRPTRRFIRTEDYHRIRHGAPWKTGPLLEVTRYLIDPRHRGLREWAGLVDYLKRQGVSNPETLGEGAVFDLITTDSERPDQGVQPEVVYESFSEIKHPERYVRPFGRDEVAELNEALGWICVDVGRQMAGDLDLPPFKALAIAEKRMRISASEYQKRITALWEVNSWVAVRAVVDDEVKGVSVCLPVTERFYREFAAGASVGYACPPDQIEPCFSRWIIVEGLATAAFEHSRRRRPGPSLVTAMLCQQAYVSDPGCPEHLALNLLSFAGTPVGQARLERFGYRPTGKRMGEFDMDLMERIIHLEGAGLADAPLIGIWQGIRKTLRAIYPRPGRCGPMVLVPDRSSPPVTS